MKIASIPKRGRKGNVIYSETRHGKVAREFVPRSNPRTVAQQDHRRNVRAVTGRWRTLNDPQRAAWGAAAANKYVVTKTGRRVRLSAYHLFVSLNVGRTDLGLPSSTSRLPSPSSVPTPRRSWPLPARKAGSASRLRVSSPPAQYTLVYAAAPVRSGVSYVNHFPFLALLPPPEDGWSDITDLYVARYGVPKPNQAIWIRICQHIDGWIDVPKVLRARIAVPAA